MSVTEAKVSGFVNKQGPSVNKVSVFKNRKYNSVVVRLTIEDDINASLVDEPPFGPRGVICKPWLTHNKLKSNGKHTVNRIIKALKGRKGRVNVL